MRLERGSVVASLLFSHCHRATFHSGPPPWAMIVRPSGEKDMLTYSCAIVGMMGRV